MLWGRFASRASEARYPQLWQGRVFGVCPSVQGPAGVNLYDTTGRSNTCTLTNMDAPTDWVRSGGRYALDFDGVNDYVTFSRAANIRSLCGANVATIAFWVYPRSTTRGAFIADWNSGGGAESARIEISGYSMTTGRIGGTVFGYSVDTIQTSSSPTLNQWHHIAISRTASGQRLWWNGVLDATDSTSYFASEETVTPAIGRGGQYPALYANAMLDDLVIYNRVISNGEARLLALRRGIAYEARRDVFGTAAAFRAYWARRQSQIIGGGV